ncbi:MULTISPECIES: DUF3545 family protein [unclassified Colwellia]|jgi:hypothetical protein|uniref:DUF3545 family protein n=1 Tax=unclassified Colwellia TaxID=196834 RepID=UPI0015F40C1A|nr:MULTISPECIES: DUF3545 family protein [unclassified Colwellia]MBA6381173.1 DUF3545 family protein [Colwellia sp. BRX10-7]MBA6388837.1 DUF3545 family protein [Colwellia sp. BRX10-2]MBA6403624.1 DUF3545 family protein [Colwellia sp. BRX10-5]MBA6407569.1 DUF3545 family protein [Colwellia sp. BRX10-1]|tara:strand:- start:773 stop:946 length:174 start_codon:yes stop_codon:yes gene_type:complete
MEHNNFDEYDEIFSLFDGLLTDQKESRSRKRKWREIETYKDRKRLRQELHDLQDYSA